MSDKKNIDRLFQEKFKDFEVAPNDAVWNRISESLPNKKKKRRVIALWWQIGGVAAIIAVLLTVGVSVFNSDGDNNQDLPIVNTDKNDAKTNERGNDLNPAIDSKKEKRKNSIDKTKLVDTNTDKNSILEVQKSNISKKDNISNQSTNPNKTKLNSVTNNSDSNQNEKEETISSQKRNNLTTNSNKYNTTKVATNTKKSENINDTTLTTKSEIKSTIKNNIEDTKTAVTDNTSSNKLESETKNSNDLKTEKSIIKDLKKESIQDAIAEQTEIINEKEDDKQNRWSIAPNVAPVYYSSLGKGSSLDSQFNENSKSSNINISYGITGSYAVSKKLKIRAGVNRVNLSQTTADVFAFTGAETAARGLSPQFSNIKFREGTSSVSLMSTEMLNLSSAPEVFNAKVAGDLEQKFGFIEVPIELEYRVLDKKFGINVIGGFSTFFLNQNDIYADIDGSSTLIGEANNINSTSFSANFGLGLDYSLSKQWNINLEPQFKYQINTFNNTTGDFRPFFIGVYTGLSFKF